VPHLPRSPLRDRVRAAASELDDLRANLVQVKVDSRRKYSALGAISSVAAARQPSLTVISALGKIVEEAVEFVGDVGVVERGGVGVVPQGRGGIRMAEPGLGLEQPPVAGQVGGHAVPGRCNPGCSTPAANPRLVSRRDKVPAARWAGRRGDGLNSQSSWGAARAAQDLK